MLASEPAAAHRNPAENRRGSSRRLRIGNRSDQSGRRADPHLVVFCLLFGFSFVLAAPEFGGHLIGERGNDLAMRFLPRGQQRRLGAPAWTRWMSGGGRGTTIKVEPNQLLVQLLQRLPLRDFSSFCNFLSLKFNLEKRVNTWKPPSQNFNFLFFNLKVHQVLNVFAPNFHCGKKSESKEFKQIWHFVSSAPLWLNVFGASWCRFLSVVLTSF